MNGLLPLFPILLTKNTLFFPLGNMNWISYSRIYNKAFSNSIFFKQITSNYRTINVSIKDLGLFKHRRWAFEKESRFVLLILPGKCFNNVHTFDIELSQWMLDVMSKNIPNSISHYDMRLDETAFTSMEVLLSPNCNPSDEIIVDSLCTRYAPNAIVPNSSLIDCLRLK